MAFSVANDYLSAALPAVCTYVVADRNLRVKNRLTARSSCIPPRRRVFLRVRVVGAHRLEACKRLGLAEIDANVVTLDDLDRQIAECDGNLCATTLTKAERALFTKRRKDAYEAKYPETKHGANQHTRSPQVEDSSIPERFTLDTARKTGVSEQTVQRDAERGEKVIDAAIDVIRGTVPDVAFNESAISPQT